MNRPAPAFAPGPLVLTGLIVAAALSRLLPHPPNFSPVEAIALFGGACFASRQLALFVPIAALLLSDLVLGAVLGASYAGYIGGVSFWSVYACIALSTVLGYGLRGRATGDAGAPGSTLGAGAAATFGNTVIGEAPPAATPPPAAPDPEPDPMTLEQMIVLAVVHGIGSLWHTRSRHTAH